MREGCELICVTLNDPDDWRDHMALFDHCFGKVEQMRIRPRSSAVKIPVADGSEIVCEIPDMEDKMIRLARGGFKHHTSVGVGHMKDILKEAFTTYLHYDWVDIDKD